MHTPFHFLFGKNSPNVIYTHNNFTFEHIYFRKTTKVRRDGLQLIDASPALATRKTTPHSLSLWSIGGNFKETYKNSTPSHCDCSTTHIFGVYSARSWNCNDFSCRICGITLFSNVSFKYLGLLCVAVVLIGATSWSFLLRDYQKQRILTFLAPTEDQLGQGYHASSTIIAVGSGKLTGRGLGHGIQSNLRFLPERQTDFLFASYAEELGVCWRHFSLFPLCSIFYASYITCISSKRPNRSRLFWSFISILFVQTAMNMGMNLGIRQLQVLHCPHVPWRKLGDRYPVRFILSLKCI